MKFSELPRYRKSLLAIGESEPLGFYSFIKSIAKGRFVIFVSLHSSKDYIKNELEKNSIPFDNFYFVDCVSAFYSNTEKEDNCTYIEAPYELDKIGKSIRKHIKRDSIVVFDSLSDLVGLGESLSFSAEMLKDFLDVFLDNLNITSSSIIFTCKKQDMSYKELEKSLKLFDAAVQLPGSPSKKSQIEFLDSEKINYAYMIILPAYNYAEELPKFIKRLINKDDKTCYVTLNKTATSARADLMRMGLFSYNVFFIDGITKTILEPEPAKNIHYLSAPLNLKELYRAIKHTINSLEISTVAIDSISNLIYYSNTQEVADFLHKLVLELQERKIILLVTVLREDKNKDLIIHSSMQFDKIIEPETGL